MVAVVTPIAVNGVMTGVAGKFVRSSCSNRGNGPLRTTRIAGSKSYVFVLNDRPRNPPVALCCDQAEPTKHP